MRLPYKNFRRDATAAEVVEFIRILWTSLQSVR